MGGVALGAALFKAKTLGRLNLGANDLGHTALHALSDSLMSGASGKQFCSPMYSSAKMEARHVVKSIGPFLTLSYMFWNPSGLKELMLDDNRMHAADLVYLIQAVSQHRGLWLLDIRGTHLQASVRSSPALVSFTLPMFKDCGFGYLLLLFVTSANDIKSPP